MSGGRNETLTIQREFGPDEEGFVQFLLADIQNLKEQLGEGDGDSDVVVVRTPKGANDAVKPYSSE